MRKRILVRNSRSFILLLLAALSSPTVIANNAFADSKALTVFKQYRREVRSCTNYSEYESVTRKYACADMVKQMDSPEVKALPKEFKERLFAIVKCQLFDEKELVVIEEDIQGNHACIKYSRKDYSYLKGTATLIKENSTWKIKKVSEEVSSKK